MLSLKCLSVVLLLAASSLPAPAQERIRIANDGALGEAWTLQAADKLELLEYPQQYADNPADACLTIGYLINPDGQVSDFSLLKSWSSREPRRQRERYWGDLADVASTALSQRRYVPRAGVAAPLPVYTVATLMFASPNALESSKRCAIPNVSEWISDLKRNPRARNRMNSSALFERLGLDPSAASGSRERAPVLHAMAPPAPTAPPPPPPPPKT